MSTCDETTTFTPRATLVIPTLERPEQLSVLVEQLCQQSTSEFEALIVDQSDVPNDAIADIAAASGGRLIYLHLERKSLPNARNVAAETSNAPILIYVDDDVELAPRFVESHLERLATGNCAAVAGRITGGYDDGPPEATQVGVFNPWLASVSRNFHTTRPLPAIEQLPGGNFSVRKSVYKEVGGFHAYDFGGPASIGEETDFACRLRAAGHTIAFEPGAHLIHLHLPRGGCRDSSVTRWTYWHSHNMTLIARRHGPLAARPLFIVAQCLRYFVHGIKRRDVRVFLKGLEGLWAGLRNPRGRPDSWLAREESAPRG